MILKNTGELEDSKQDGTVYYFDADGNVTKATPYKAINKITQVKLNV